MTALAAAVVAGVTVATLAALALRGRRVSGAWRVALPAGVVAALLAGWLSRYLPDRFRDVTRRSNPDSATEPLARFAAHTPAEEAADGYVSSSACLECHDHQHATWHASYHRTMTQRATPEAVVGVFDGRPLEFDGVGYRLTRRGDEFWARISHPDTGAGPQIVERPIVLVTGSHHMQVYWFPTGNDRTIAEFPLYFLKEDRQWVPRDASFLKPRDPDPSAPGIGRWNTECILCHTTHGRSRPRQDGQALAADSLVAEFGIACEACHGPGARHVAAQRGDTGALDAIVNPAGLTSHRSAQVCGRCHSVTLPKQHAELAGLLDRGHQFRPGDALEDSLHLVRRNDATRARLKDGIVPDDRFVDRAFDLQFWRDGMVRVSGREFNGLVESGCYLRGELSCISCHDMHQSPEDTRSAGEWADDQLRASARGDAACTQCHAATQYANSLHTHHAAASAGSRCYNCHMPHTSYGLLKAIRSHTIDSPGVAASVEAGRPNACNLCHLDRSLGWTAGWLSDWYRITPPELTATQQTTSAAVVWALQGDAGQRALVAWHMGWDEALDASGRQWQAPWLAELLGDPYLAVRYLARRSLRRLPGFEEFNYDFVGPQEVVDAAAAEALQRWRDTLTQGAARVIPPGTLIAPDGTLRQEQVDRLRQARDESPVSLVE